MNVQYLQNIVNQRNTEISELKETNLALVDEIERLRQINQDNINTSDSAELISCKSQLLDAKSEIDILTRQIGLLETEIVSMNTTNFTDEEIILIVEDNNIKTIEIADLTTTKNILETKIIDLRNKIKTITIMINNNNSIGALTVINSVIN
jgi:hypothetical protein